MLISSSLSDINLEGKLVDGVTADLYGILGQLYSHELDSELSLELIQSGFLKMLDKIDPGFSISEFLRSLDFRVLEAEFARLFRDPEPQSPPLASVYRKDDQRQDKLWGSTTREGKKFKVHYGLELKNTGTIPDHISDMFEFIQKLLLEKIEAFERNDDIAYREADEIQKQFFRDYIEPWAETFLQKILKAKPLPFYAAVAELTTQFIKQQKILE